MQRSHALNPDWSWVQAYALFSSVKMLVSRKKTSGARSETPQEDSGSVIIKPWELVKEAHGFIKD